MTDLCTNNIFLIIFFPIWVCLIILSGVFFKLTINRKIITLLTLLSTITGLIFSLVLFNHSKVFEKSYLWINTNDLNICLGAYIDSISSIFLVILMLISLLVQIYSYGFMKNKVSFERYFILLNFFNFAMAGLVLAPNLIQLYIFWELVGIASYMLIGFFYDREDVSKSAKKVFLINRIGDCALLCGIIIFAYFSIVYINQQADCFLAFSDLENFHNQLESLTYPNVYNIICLLFLIGAFVKSAQFPFQQWLVDAMKAPTPVSALIHSATMVCAGIFLTIRIFPLLSSEIRYVILFVGLITAVISAFIAIGQTNIKKMLAYSTASQLGLMFILIGLGEISIAIIYMVIHSFTKALLFLCTGNISEICNTIEMKEISGLRRTNFYLSVFWLIGAISLAGIFFGGFTSKEMLINALKFNNSAAILFLVLLTSFMSAYYIFRAYFNIFEGENSTYKSLKERSMTFALTILCLFVILPGFLFKLENINLLCILAVAISITAVICAYYHNKCRTKPMPIALYKLAQKELYIPEIYDLTGKIFSYLYKFVFLFDSFIIDGIINLIVKFNKFISDIISKLQNGNIQTYISYSLFSSGIILMLLVYLYFLAIRS